jgi:ribose transport system ATP-binding protein
MWSVVPLRLLSEKLMTIPVLQTQAVSKRFGPVEALVDVSLAIYPGRVHTLLGENGAGKSTLMKILAGVHAPTTGSVLMDGREVVFANPEHARNSGIAIIYQELSLSKNLTVAQNIFANHEPRRWGMIDDRALLADAQRLLDSLHIAIDAATPVAHLSMAQCQLVEIAKALSHAARVVIMDEPTSSLSDSEAQTLFGIIDTLKARDCAVIYVSHRMDEIMRISDDISVMRDGRYISTVNRQDTTIGALIALMVGREMRDVYPPRPPVPATSDGRVALRVDNLSRPGKFTDVSFELRAGEILGFFGLIGAGRSEVMKAVFGTLGCTGKLEINGEAVRIRHPFDAIARGIAFVTENRKEEGLSLQHSVERNINSVNLRRMANRLGVVKPARERAAAKRWVQRTGIKTAGLEELAGHLSGGNQQKIVFSKWLEIEPRILILDEPTRGVDVGAKYEIYKIIRELAAGGTAIIFVSSELPEVLAMSDRLIVMREQRIVHQFDTTGLTQEAVMSYAAGVQHHVH